MPLVSITRLRLRGWRYLPGFAVYTLRSARQAARSEGFLGGWIGGSGNKGYWTITVWRDEAAMKAFRDREAHKTAMPKLLHWCDEAAMVRFDQTASTIPDGENALRMLAERGRTSKVRHPTADHSAGRTAPDGRPPRPGRRLIPVNG